MVGIESEIEPMASAWSGDLVEHRQPAQYSAVQGMCKAHLTSLLAESKMC